MRKFTVYVVTHGRHSDRHNAGIFTSQEEAQIHADLDEDRNGCVEEWVVNANAGKIMRDCWRVLSE